MADDPITLDITGFYYSCQVPFTGPGQTVFDVLQAATGIDGNNGGRLAVTLDAADRYVETLTVTYDTQPLTRQRPQNDEPIKIGQARPIGPYTFTDDVRDEANRVRKGGEVGLLTWQYYVFDKTGRKKPANGLDRFITPSTQSNLGKEPIILAPGDRITFRVVCIFGIAELIDSALAQDELVASAEGQVSLKAALGMMRSVENVDAMQAAVEQAVQR